MKTLVVVYSHRKTRDAVKFLTSQVELDIDAVKMVNEAREELR